MATPQPLPDWLPPARKGARTLPAGRWWDAVEVDGITAGYVLGRLGERSGPVVEDQMRGVARWLLAPGVAAGWELPGVRVLGHGHYVTVPPAEWCVNSWEGAPPIRWSVPPVRSCLSDPVALHRALAHATVSRTVSGVTLVTGLEGRVEPSVPVTCSYCHCGIVVDNDHAGTCPWKRGRSVAR
ncbi:hypothetical protein [Streptomyces mayteni]